MKCEDFEELLSAYADGELNQQQKTFVEKHLVECPACRAKADNHRLAREQLSSGIKTPVMPDIKESVMQRISSRNPVFRARSSFIAVPVALILILLLVLQPWSIGPAAQTVLARASEAMSSIQTYHVTRSPSIAYNGMDDSLNSGSDWEFILPDKIHLIQNFDGVPDEFIIIGDKQYYRLSNNLTLNAATNIFTLSGQNYPIISNSQVSSPIITAVNPPSEEVTLQELNSMTGLQQLPDETINGVNCYHYKGIFGTTPLELWIGKSDYLIRQKIKQTGINDAKNQPINSTTIYSDFNAEVSINPPVDGAGNLLPGWGIAE